ncbi:beta-ketoacyl synthase chain length factor [Dinghuibacter silviterrae]|uniref:Beta-ketoacyl synthase-like protein n=1 Tax=Dinghuibacter silviterrae TaxID=1539049 RepID=A0A4R8DV33_9BACT|nr:beta-ketoacyl synthase chain length factor [Dinghuibacter silviterrae]TDX02272.1 beta-ketoacyl synthase-like protein [Dinghuibacter silviterrae]
MLYLHQSCCISPQRADDLDTLQPSRDNQLFVIEPPYPGIPPGLLRRMGKAVKISVGAALPLLQDPVDGIIIGTGNGGLEDCVKFLDQIVQYEEGMLTPANFVQSTANAMASQISLLSRNKGYNITHVHRGLAFEQALLDAMLFAEEVPDKYFLLGGADEISSYNNNIEMLSGAFKQEPVSNTALYDSTTPGSLAGESAALFRVSGVPSRIAIRELVTFHTRDTGMVLNRLLSFDPPDLLLTGENGDARLKPLYETVESALGAPVARFKHQTGEHPTAVAAGLWLAQQIIEKQHVPSHMVKSPGTAPASILLYNTYKGVQHSFILISTVND